MSSGWGDVEDFKSPYSNQDYKIEYKPIGTEHILPSGFIKFIKHTKLIWIPLLISYGSINSGEFFMTYIARNIGESKDIIEQSLEDIKAENIQGKITKFIFKDIGKPGRELAYRLYEKK